MSNPPLPPFLSTSDPGSFARQTILERKPQIIRQVLADNTYPETVVAALASLGEEIASRPVQPLTGSAADVPDWNREMAGHAGKTWLEIPWYFAETYFYRRLLEAVGYFPPGDAPGHDPFGMQKEEQMKGDVRRLAPAWEQFTGLATRARFEALLHSS